jgi:hypothetical protein
MRNTKTRLVVVLPLILGIFVTLAVAKTFVSFKGGFYFDYPEDWDQVPYLTADLFLSRSAQDQAALNYEAVFAPKSSSPFFATDYLILAVDTVEWLYDYQIDSVVEEMEKTFGEDMKYFPSWDQPTDLKSNSPVYDKSNRILTVTSDIVSGDRIVKKNLMVKKFYDKGIANFYFYSPDTLFEKSKVVFQEMVNSFSVENVAQAVPKEEGKVGGGESDELSFRKMLVPIGAALIILIVLLVRLRKSKRIKPSE